MALLGREMWHQAGAGVLAVDLINEGVHGQSGRTWLGINALLSAAANVSKALWPPRGEPRDELVALCGLDDEAVIRRREVRNHLEHVEERIVTQYERDPYFNLLDTYIGPADSTGLDGVWVRFREYDPETTVVSFMGDAIQLQDVVRELEQVMQRMAPTSPVWTEP